MWRQRSGGIGVGFRTPADWRLWAEGTRRRELLLDGNAYFSRPGPRLVDSLEILAYALHPQAHPLPENMPAAQLVAEGDTNWCRAAIHGTC